MRQMKHTYLALGLLLGSSGLAGCIPLVDLYIVGEGGYQLGVKTDVPAVVAVPAVAAVAANPSAVPPVAEVVAVAEVSGVATTTNAKGVIYGGGVGLGLSALRLYTGVEVNFAGTMVKQSIPREDAAGNEIVTPAGEQVVTEFAEKWTLNAMAEVGAWISEDLLLFARGGYVFTLKDLKDVKKLDLKDNTWAVGGGLEYQIGGGLGVRTYYLNHLGARRAHEVRGGVVWRF